MNHHTIMLLLVGCVIHNSAVALTDGMDDSSGHSAPKTREFVMPDFSEQSAKLSAIYIELIIESPEWKQVKDDYRAGKLNENQLNFIIDEIGHGDTKAAEWKEIEVAYMEGKLDESQLDSIISEIDDLGSAVTEARADIGWSPSAITRRSKRAVKRASPGMKMLARHPAYTIGEQVKTWIQHVPRRLEEGRYLKKLGRVGGGLGLLAYDISLRPVVVFALGFARFFEGTFTVADLLDVLFIPCVLILCLTKRGWLLPTTGMVWSIDLIFPPAFILHHIAATVMWVATTLFLRWLNSKWNLYDDDRKEPQVG